MLEKIYMSSSSTVNETSLSVLSYLGDLPWGIQLAIGIGIVETILIFWD